MSLRVVAVGELAALVLVGILGAVTVIESRRVSACSLLRVVTVVERRRVGARRYGAVRDGFRVIPIGEGRGLATLDGVATL